MNSTLNRLRHSAVMAYPKGLKTAWWLIKITVPVSFGVMLLQYFGLLEGEVQITVGVSKRNPRLEEVKIKQRP